MRVYSVLCDVNRYQSFYLLDRKRVEHWVDDSMLQFDATPKLEFWQPLELFVLRPKLKVPNFWNLEIPGALLADLETAEKMDGFFARAGEVLPVRCDGREYKLLNVLECLNNLDREKSTWLVTEEGERVYPKKYVFHPDRFSESSLFKIPDTNCVDIFTWEETGNPETEFKAAVEHHKLTGLKFELVWEE